jgi:hypothetical protein
MQVLPFRQLLVDVLPQAALSLTCGYENYVPAGLASHVYVIVRHAEICVAVIARHEAICVVVIARHEAI